MSKIKLSAICIVMVSALCACTRSTPDTPSGVVVAYVKQATEAKSIDDKKHLMDLTTGSAREDLEKMSEQQFKDQFINSRLKLKNISTKDLREENSGDVSLVYEIEYDEQGAPGAAADASYSNKKIAYLSKDDQGKWKIKETKNLKSFVEQKDALELLGGSNATAPSPQK